MVKAIPTARVHGPDATERVDALGTQGAGAVAEAQVMMLEGEVTIPGRVERACVSLERGWGFGRAGD